MSEDAQTDRAEVPALRTFRTGSDQPYLVLPRGSRRSEPDRVALDHVDGTTNPLRGNLDATGSDEPSDVALPGRGDATPSSDADAGEPGGPGGPGR